jgi:hypothetical protein
MDSLNFIGNSFLARLCRAKKLFLTPKTLFPIKSIKEMDRKAAQWRILQIGQQPAT